MEKSPSQSGQAPPAQGVRLQWDDIPQKLRLMIDQWLGSAVIRTVSSPSGFSPGVASLLITADGRRAFLKAIGPEPNPHAVGIHRREVQISSLLPQNVPVPPLLWSYDDEQDTGWVVLLFEAIDGHHPQQPWSLAELDRILAALRTLSEMLTPSPISGDVVATARDRFANYFRGWKFFQADEAAQTKLPDAWSARHLQALARLEQDAADAVDGDSLIHFDTRADNILLTAEKVWFLDWPHACLGAPWVDVILFAPSVTMQGGPPPQDVLHRYLGDAVIDEAMITAVITAMAGFFTYQATLPPPPGLPTLREFQNAQAVVSRQWVAQRTGWV